MTDSDRNTRTLIVSFVVALMVMVPLRFVEATQTTLNQTVQVLGEMTQEPTNAVPVEPAASLEAPYDEIETSVAVADDCLTLEQSGEEIGKVIEKHGGSLNNLTQAETQVAYDEIKTIDDRICR